MDLMVKIAMAIEREVDDARSIRDVGVKDLSLEVERLEELLYVSSLLGTRVNID